jgi:hypothetical protein
MIFHCAVAVLVLAVRMNSGGVLVAGAPTTMDVRVEEDGFHEEFKEAPVFSYENRAGLRGCDSHAGKVGVV